MGITAMGALFCLLTVGQAAAFNQEHLDKLREQNACVECDLSGANLSGANLVETDRSGATWVDGRQCAEGSIGECK